MSESKLEPMKPVWRLGFVMLFFFVAASSTLFSQQSPKTLPATQRQSVNASTSTSTSKGQAERGRYLVEEVAKCAECHTPRDEDGNVDRSRWLQGATIWIKPVHPMQNWAEWAPGLAGLPGFTDEQAQQILEHGIGPNGAPIRPPMHIYHLTHADADAIISYLRSLSAKTSQN